ncbi:MAG: hypothetical protein IH946_00755 [Bacteroidetes bacterium]|nr:hypothetical protein [Bacteroidota bacterium]
MGLQPGQTNNPSGRKIGSKNKKTKAWEKLGDFLTNDGAARAKKIMMNSEDREFMVYYFRFVEFFKPKPSSTQLSNLDRTIIVHVDGEDPD